MEDSAVVAYEQASQPSEETIRSKNATSDASLLLHFESGQLCLLHLAELDRRIPSSQRRGQT